MGYFRWRDTNEPSDIMGCFGEIMVINFVVETDSAQGSKRCMNVHVFFNLSLIFMMGQREFVFGFLELLVGPTEE